MLHSTEDLLGPHWGPPLPAPSLQPPISQSAEVWRTAAVCLVGTAFRYSWQGLGRLTFWWHLPPTFIPWTFLFSNQNREKRNKKGQVSSPAFLLSSEPCWAVQYFTPKPVLSLILLPWWSVALCTANFLPFLFFNRKFVFYNFSLKTVLLNIPPSLLLLDEKISFLDLKELSLLVMVLHWICTWFNCFSLLLHVPS